MKKTLESTFTNSQNNSKIDYFKIVREASPEQYTSISMEEFKKQMIERKKNLGM